jgi:hypothetical protein
MEHIEYEKLVDNLESGNADSLTAEVAAHLDECTRCSAELRRLVDFFAYVAPGFVEEVPQATTARILNIYERRPLPDAEPIKTATGLGFLVFDEWATALNERYSGIDSRQMLYRIGRFDVDLRIDFIADKCRLVGQVLPGIEGAMITLSSPKGSISVPLTEFGEFEFEPAEPGTYSLAISGTDEDLKIEEVPLHQW